MDEMGIEVQNLFWAFLGSGEGQANQLVEPFSSFLEGLEEKKGEIPLIGPKEGQLTSPREEKGIEAWEIFWEGSPFLFSSKETSLRGMKRPGVEQLSTDVTSVVSGEKEVSSGEKKTAPTAMGILGHSLDPGKLPREVPRSKESLPFETRSSGSELCNLKSSCSGEAIPQLNALGCGLNLYGLVPVGREEHCLSVSPQEEISSRSLQVRESGGQCNAISGPSLEISKDKGQDDSVVSFLGSWARIHGKGGGERWDFGPSLNDPHGLAHLVGARIESPRDPLSEARGSSTLDTQNGQGARGQGAIGAIGVKEATKSDTSLGGFEVGDFSPPLIGSSESSGQARGPSSPPIELHAKEASEPEMAFGFKDSRTEASQEGPLWEDDSSVTNQSFKTPSPVEDSRPELSRFPGISEEKRSRGELATFKGPRKESPSIKREELGQSPEIRPPEPGSLLSKDSPLLSPSKGETAQVNGSQRLLQPHGRELGEGPFQTVQIVFKEAEDLTRIRLRLHQNNLDALFVVTSAEKKSELEANLGQLQRELFQSGFLPQLAVEVGGRYANSGFQMDTPMYPHQESETKGRDIHEEVFLSGSNPLDGSIHLTV